MTIAPNTLDEQDYTPQELAEKKKLHVRTIVKLFMDEPDVIRLGHAARSGKRQYFTLRIPRHVAERVFNRMRVRGRTA